MKVKTILRGQTPSSVNRSRKGPLLSQAQARLRLRWYKVVYTIGLKDLDNRIKTAVTQTMQQRTSRLNCTDDQQHRDLIDQSGQ